MAAVRRHEEREAGTHWLQHISASQRIRQVDCRQGDRAGALSDTIANSHTSAAGTVGVCESWGMAEVRPPARHVTVGQRAAAMDGERTHWCRRS